MVLNLSVSIPGPGTFPYGKLFIDSISSVDIGLLISSRMSFDRLNLSKNWCSLFMLANFGVIKFFTVSIILLMSM
jgi:hypothetical protein